MSDIQWNESNEVEPEANSIHEFCHNHSISIKSKLNQNHQFVFINKAALKSLHDFLGHDLRREHGGVLVGKPFVDKELGITFLLINSAIPAMETEGSSVHLQFTPETWSYISGIIEENYPDQVVVGWYHSHPGLGVFMSGTDRATQRAFYNHPWSVAVVADPVAQKTGWFVGEECIQLSNSQVIPYIPYQSSIDLKTREREISHLERDYWKKQREPYWRWLLPFGFLALGILGMMIWYKRKMDHREG